MKWRVGIGKFKNEREKGDEHFSVFDENSACVAHLWSKADAQLMAAAPELLAACEEMVEKVYAVGGADVLIRARAAIEKARGKS